MVVATLETPSLAGMQLRLLTVENVFEMVEAGILGEDERVELVEGVLVQMSPEGRPHVVTIRELNGRLGHHYPWPQYHVQVQSTQPLTDHRLRIPDLIVARRVLGEWLVPADVVLCIEVAETSHAQDTGAKAREYAQWGVPVYWVVDLDARLVEVWAPGDEKPAIVDRLLTWRPADAAPALIIDVPAYFQKAWAEE